jgi:polar amino acid transport system substrate-binding protein
MFKNNYKFKILGMILLIASICIFLYLQHSDKTKNTIIDPITPKGEIEQNIKKNKITISTAPYNSKKVEQVISILKKAYNEINLDVEVVVMPGERSLVSADTGVTDGDLHRIDGIQKIYKHLVIVQIPLAINTHSAFTKGLEFKVDGYSSLKPYRIAYTRGFKAIEKGTNSGFKTFPVKDDESAFMMLNDGRVDVVITDYDDGVKTLNELKMPDIHPLSPPVETIALYHFVNEKHITLVPMLEKALENVKPVK